MNTPRSNFRPRTRRASVVALMTCAAATAFTGCSSEDDVGSTSVAATEARESAVGEGAPPVSMPLLGTRSVPPELASVTGIAWNGTTEHFVVVTEGGQVASLAGDSFALTGVVDAGAGALGDVAAAADGVVAISAAGDVLSFEIDESGTPRPSDTPTIGVGFEPRGVAVPPRGGRPTVSRDGPAGPTLWSVGDGGAIESLQLDDASLTATRSLSFLGSRILASSADTPTVAVFDESGALEVRLAPEGLASIGGVTNRDGTFVFAGTGTDGEAVFAAYDLENGEENDPDPASGPATLTATLRSSERLALPEGIRQPSGIVHDAPSDSFLFSTDQAEFFALSPDLSEVRFAYDIPGFNQGAVEDIQSIGPGAAVVVTEEADYVPFSWDGATWSAGAIVPVDAVDEEVSAIGFDPGTGQLVWIPESGPGKSLIVTTPAGEPVREIELDTRAVGLENLDEYTVAGLTYHDGMFYVLSERYSTVFVMSPEGVVASAYGLEDAAEASGLTVFDGSIWVVFDHEDSRPVPPVARFPLPPTS